MTSLVDFDWDSADWTGDDWTGWDDDAVAELDDYWQGGGDTVNTDPENPGGTFDPNEDPWGDLSGSGGGDVAADDGTTGGINEEIEKIKEGSTEYGTKVTDSINKLLGSNFTGKQLASMAGIFGGGIAGLMGALKPKVTKAGYQGEIPKYDAVRNMVTAPPATVDGKPYRPGQGGINWGGGVSYVPKGSTTATGQAGSVTPGGGTTTSGGINNPGITEAFKAKQDGFSYGSGVEQDKYTAPKQDKFKGGYGDTPETFDFGERSRAHVMPYTPTTNIDPNSAAYAQGGIAGLARGRYLQGGTDGMADKIPARIGRNQPAALSHGEFVIPADVVSHLGNGNSDAGANKLYQMMDRIRQARTGTKKQGKQINPDKFMPGGLAKAYAQGGAIKHYATGGAAAASSAGITGSETAPNTWAGGYMSDMLAKGQALSNAPYQQYGGPLTAGASDLQNKVFTGLQGTNFPTNLGTSFSSAGAPTIGADGQPVGGGTSPASQYMNPYLQSVLTPQLAELRRQNQITNMGTNAKLTGAGAFGGGRQAIMNAENNRNLMQEMNKTVGQGYASAYDKAMNQFNTEQGQGMGLARLLADQGNVQRNIEAEGIAADKKSFEEARENPYKMVEWQQSLLNGMPISAENYQMSEPNWLEAFAGGATTAADAIDVLTGNKPAVKKKD